jgi:acyl-lipid omega-6 desaturase (Delta-12 desaturase)
MKRPEWLFKLKFYTKANPAKSINQLCNTVIPYLILMITMMLFLKKGAPYWLILLFIPVASLFLVRTFILQHDCSHGSFFTSKTACSIIGHFLGVLSFTPFFDWQKSHFIHHVSVGNLERRGTGDIWVMTVEEFKNADRWRKFLYWLYRTPFVLLILGPVFTFLLIYRFPRRQAKIKEVLSVIFTDVMIIFIIITAYNTVGIVNYLLVQLPVIYLGGVLGIWLFYIQHQFPTVYWEHNDKWEMYRACMEGSSYYKMPRILQWFTGNIGFHNLHHLNPKIPNYKLMQCYKDMPEMRGTITITLVRGFRSLFLHLWDEETRRLISFGDLKKRN